MSKGSDKTQKSQDLKEGATVSEPPSKNKDTKIDAKIEASSFGSSEPTDGRGLTEWESAYPARARRIIHCEALVLVILFFLSLALLLFTWGNTFDPVIDFCCGKTLTADTKSYFYFAFSGLLAGVIFSIKYLYHVVARKLWHIDRQLWRFLSPLMSLGVAFIVGVLINANLVQSPDTSAIRPSTAISIGFIAGYFSDTAIAKMYEIANVLFGTTNKSK